MKGISTYGLPYGFSYQIHGHNGLNGSEREAHVHIRKGSSFAVSISLSDGRSILAGEAQFAELSKRDRDDILSWVSSNLSALRKEWDDADDPASGGRS